MTNLELKDLAGKIVFIVPKCLFIETAVLQAKHTKS